MAVIHISQEDAERDFGSLLKRLDANTSFVIEDGARVFARLGPEPTLDPSLGATIARLKESRSGVIDDEFALAVQDFIKRHRDPLDLSILE